MKGKLLTILLLGLLISSCSSIDQPEEASELPPHGIEDIKFLNFDISLYQDNNTRNDNDGSWETKPGTSEENQINRIFFYFFDKEGNAIKVRDGSDVNSPLKEAFDWVSSGNNSNGGSSSGSDNILSVSLALRFAKNVMPEQLLTIVNPNFDLNAFSVTNISDLQGKVMNFYTGLTDANFVMTNSVYVVKNANSGSGNATGSQSVVCATPITSENICFSAQEALLHPVMVYVDRVLARIDFKFLMEEAQEFTVPEGVKVFKISSNIKREGDASSTDIYVKFLGWTITSTSTTSWLFKKVDNSWDVDKFFSSTSSWNSSNMHRSIWSANPAGLQYQWFTFNDMLNPSGNFDYGNTYNMTVSRAYIQENANPYNEGTIALANPEYPSKVIFAAQIVDASGNALDIAEYEGKYYKVEDLKTLIAGRLDMWYENGKDNDGNNIITQIDKNHISFQTSMERKGESGPGEKETYYVYFTLSDEAKNMTWYHYFTSEDEKDSKLISKPQIQTYIDTRTTMAKVWTSGYAYYYYDITHCKDVARDKPGSLGVVRNNIYYTKIKAITGLGTPVYKPGDTIYPENPEPTNPLVVTVEKLEWRKENQDVILSW